MNLSELFAQEHTMEVFKRNEIFVPLFTEFVEKQNEIEWNPSEEPVFRASGIGYCGRSLLYKLKGGYTEKKTLQEIFTLNVGTKIHELIQEYIAQMPIAVTSEEVVTLEEIPWISGHYDYILKIGPKKYLLEIKTQNVEAYQNMWLRPNPYDSHKKQATIYMKALGLDETIFLYVNKNTNLLKDFAAEHPEINPIMLELHYKYDEKMFEDRKDFVEELVEHFKSGTMPEAKRCTQCNWCAFKEQCLKDRKIERKNKL